jgi:hypothetical protein
MPARGERAGRPVKKLLLVLMALLCFGSVAWAEDAAPSVVQKTDGTPLITSVPERKAPSTLKDVLTASDAQKIQKLVSDMIVDYNANRNKMTAEAWSQQILKARMTGVSDKRINEITSEIANSIKLNTEKQQSLAKAVKGGASKQSWLDGQLKKYITKAVDATTDTPEEGSKSQISGFSLASVDWGGKTLTDAEADVLKQDLVANKDAGLITAVACALVLASNDPSIAVVGNATPRLLTTIAINSVEEAKTVLKVKSGSISGKEGAVRLADTAMASIVGLLAGFDYKQIGFVAGTAAGTAAGGAIDGATGGISLGTITINGALIGAYLGEKIGTKLGATLNATLDTKLHAKIVSEFEGFLGSTILTVLNVHDVKPAVEEIDKASDKPAPAPEVKKEGLPDNAGLWDKAVFYVKAAGNWCMDKASAGWQEVVKLTKSFTESLTNYWHYAYQKVL